MSSPEPGARAAQLEMGSAFERSDGGVTVAQLQDVSAVAVGVIEVNVSRHAIAAGDFEFELPAQAAEVLQDRRDAATATLLDGAPLPPWLEFNAATLNFSARGVPSGALPLQVQVQAGSFRLVIEISLTKDVASPRRSETAAYQNVPTGINRRISNRSVAMHWRRRLQVSPPRQMSTTQDPADSGA